MFTIKNIKKEHMIEQIKLFSICFPRNKKFDFDYLNWLYYKNPAGNVLGFNAFYKKRS